MSGTELIMGMGEVINYLKDLEAENKKLKRANEINSELHKTMEKTIGELEKEIKNLKEYQPKGSQIDPEGLHDYMKEEIDKLKEENERLRKTVSDATLERIRALDDVMERNQEIKKLKEQKFVYDKEVWSPVELHRILDNYDLNWNEVCEEVKKLKEKNNKLVEYINALTVQANADNEELQSCIKQQEKDIEELKSNLDYDPEEAEIVSKDYIKKLKDDLDFAGGSYKQKEEEILKLKNKLNVSEINRTEAESELESFHDYHRDNTDFEGYDDWLKENYEDYSGTWLDNWCSEKLDKYEDGDDWDEACGYTIKNGEYRICMAGGGDHWYDYVITKDGCFIHNKEGKKKVFTFVSCPNANYIKVWDTPDMEGGLVLDEGETDLYETIKDAYEEEIMNYEPEE